MSRGTGLGHARMVTDIPLTPQLGSTLMAAQTPSIMEPNLTDRLGQDSIDHRAPLHSFDPAASPAEKAAAIQNGTDKLQSVIPQDHTHPRGLLYPTSLPPP